MKRPVAKLTLLFVLIASAIALLAQTNNPFIGKWELNVAKSKFSPGPGPKSETVIASGSETAIEGTDSSGKPVKWSFKPAPGSAVPIEGMDNSTVEEKISGNTLDHNWKLAGGTTHGHGVLSKDGKTLKYTETGKDGQGRKVHNLYVFERQ